MNDVQEAKNVRRKGANRFFVRYHETSYNTLRETFRLQNSERRKSDITNLLGHLRLVLDYDLLSSKLMAFLNSRARVIVFVSGGFVDIMTDLVVDVLFCILYLAEVQYWVNFLLNGDTTSYPDPNWLFVPRPHLIWAFALAMSTWNIMSAVIRFIFADNKLRFIFSIQTLLDAVTAVPFLVATAFLPGGQYLYVPYFLRSWSAISRLQRALSIGVEIGISDKPFDPVKAKLIGLLAYLVAILYNATCAFMYCEMTFVPGATTLSILDAFYYILITGSTVGYGDITPKSYASKVVIMVFIIVALAILPGLIAGTIDTIKSSRAGGGSYSQSWGRSGNRKPYLVLIGNFQNARRVHDMLNGFFNKEFSDGDVRIVFLSRDKPSRDVKTLLGLPTYMNKATMLVGNGLDEADLKRCQVRDSKGVFIIPAEQYSSERETEDTITTLLSWSVHLHAPQTPIYSYNLLPETESYQSGIVEQSVCIPDIKQLLLAYNCRHQATGTLILNLLLPSEPAESYEYGWQAQYGDSSGNEIYMAEVPAVFVGWTFAQAASLIFQDFQSILIGVDIYLSQDVLNGTRGTFAQDTRPLQTTLRRSSIAGVTFRNRWGSASFNPSNNGIPSSSSSSASPGYGLDGKNDFDISMLNNASGTDKQYHLTLNPGNSYRLGSKDRLIFIAQSPNDIAAICRFTVGQYEQLIKDERGFYQETSRNFSRAMEKHIEIHAARANARAAARQRAETKAAIRASKRRARDEMMAASPVARGADLLSRSCAPGRTAASSYAPCRETAISVVEEDPTEEWSAACPQDAIEAARSEADTESAALCGLVVESEESCDDSDGEDHVHQDSEKQEALLAQPKDCPVDESVMMQTLFGSQCGKGGLVSAFERNAVAAAAMMEDGSSTPSLGSPVEELDQNLSLASAVNETQTEGLTSGATLRATSLDTDGHDYHADGVGTNGRGRGSQKSRISLVSTSSVNSAASLPMQTRSGRVGGGATAGARRPKMYRKIHESFRTLDETTYIGQAPVARSETRDLPLYHLLIDPPKSIHSRLKKDLTRLKNHVLVCSPPGEDLYRFIATLRLAPIGSEDLKTIVVLTNGPLDEGGNDGDDGSPSAAANGSGAKIHGNAILAFPRVYWIIGNCRQRRDLVRAGLLGANRIVVMSHAKECDGSQDEFADSVAIMANHMIHQTLYERGLLGRQSIVVELKESTNIRFLRMRPDLTELFAFKKRLSPPRAVCIPELRPPSSSSPPSQDGTRLSSTRGATTAMPVGPGRDTPTELGLDAAASSAKPYALGQGSGLRSSQVVMSPIYASGQVLVGSLLDNVLFQSYTKKHIIDLIKLCCGVRFKQASEMDQLLGVDCSHVCLVNTPTQFVGKAFLKLFQELALVHGVIPLGLFRAPDQQLGNVLPFVFTNPLPGILLRPGDQIYVLRP
ncbi:hypothetical protein DFQ26_005503 [Actinomortierella ambigua]|nr:hypothetical protein DFQ26_005503 [Actinomortierella ambigua]